MAINATNESKPRELIPAGNYIGRCYKMLEIGTVEETVQGKLQNNRKARIGWELPTELKVFDETKGEQPLVIDEEYNLYMNDKANLRKMLQSWRGQAFTEEQAKSFDITKLLGVPCMINIIHNPSKSDPTKVYNKIASITPMPKGINCPPQITKTQKLEFDNFDWDLFNSLPEFIKNKIKTSKEFKALGNDINQEQPNNEAMMPQSLDAQPTDTLDDLPF